MKPKRTNIVSDKYTAQIVECNPRKMSERNIAIKGTKKDLNLFEKEKPESKAIAETGVKFGGCGRNLERTAIAIKAIEKVSFFCKKLFFIYKSFFELLN
jgi:hypothetical protein